MPKPKNWEQNKKKKDERWPGRKTGPYEWFEVQDSTAYYAEFSKVKILWPGISAEIAAFTIEKEEYFGNDNTHLIIESDLYLLGLLKSRVSKHFIESICDAVQSGFYRLKLSSINKLPIATPDEETRASITQLVEQILSIKQADAAADTLELEAEVDVLVYRLYGLTYEEVLLVDPTFAMPREAYELAQAAPSQA